MNVHLTDEELENPYLALETVFSNYKLPELRTALKEIEKNNSKNHFHC
jgi:hypothetical protein